MFSQVASADIVLSMIASFGILQMAWFSVMLVRRGAPTEVIQQAIPAFLTVWVLMWPVYSDKKWLAAGLIVFFLVVVLAAMLKTPFWQHLRVAWGAQEFGQEKKPSLVRFPQLPYFMALCLAGACFQVIPELGFGLALCLCVAFPAAHWSNALIRRYGADWLDLSTLLKQSLLSHLIFVGIASFLLCWTWSVYQAESWHVVVLSTLAASLAASVCRAVVPAPWSIPVAILSMGLVLVLM